MAKNENIKTQKMITIVGIILFIVKIIAWLTTNSVAILTDALESTVNIATAFIGLYSLNLAAKPKDQNHPYGHGKVEFISATIEGILITIAGLAIIIEAIRNIQEPHQIQKLDYGIYLVGFTAIINYVLGYIAIREGKKNHSLQLVASGKHLQTDTYSTLGIILGLILLYYTKIILIDSVVALIFSVILIITGYKIMREAISGIMDEADDRLLNNVVAYIESVRKPNWVDLHNLRIIKYGSTLHFDCHLTVPWYFTVLEAHSEISDFEKTIQSKYGESVELFVHTDACLDFSCKICVKTDCQHRKHSFINKLDWNLENISQNQKHGF